MHALAAIALVLAVQDAGFDFSRIERKLKGEPKYEAAPKYAMLMVGSEGKIRMWMALDVVVGEDVVYIDRDGDGILGEGGERFVARKSQLGHLSASIGKIEFPEQKTVLEDLVVHTRQARQLRSTLRVSFRMNGRVSVFGGRGELEWADSLLKAPIFHADPFGTLTFLNTGAGELKIGQDENVTLSVGTWGSGPDTFCTVDEEFLDLEKDELYVTVIAKDAKGGEIKKRFQLKEHC